MESSASKHIFKDREIVWFYSIIVGILGLVLALGLVAGEIIPNLIILAIILCFLVFGWPISAELTHTDGNITFKGPIRHTTVTSKNLATVKVVGAHDYRAHIVLRTKWGIPIGYRCRKYTDASALAQALIELIDRSSNVMASDDALKLLHRTAQGKTAPLA